ncbi:MAG TPA: hypothetical protein VIM16_09435 [Mucilaginibacter sp.]|jgi:hypothetical protein
MKTLFLLLLFVAALPLPKPVNNHLKLSPPQADSGLIKLENKKALIDQYITKHSKTLIVFVKVPGKKDLAMVKNDKWPDEIEYTVNILKNSSGKIIFIAQMLDSESGDWSIIYKHYFDEQGNTYAFSKAEFFFDDNIKSGAVHLRVLNYYDTGFNVINKINQLTDGNDKVLKGDKNLYNQFHNDYSIYKNLSDCLVGYNIKLAN